LILQIRGLAKAFPGVQALAGIDLDVRRGEIHAVMGENGAGKSTLMRILAGLERADSGQLSLDGRPSRFRQPLDALRAGIVMIHQELLPFPNLTVAENLFLGQLPSRGVPGWLDGAALRRQARAALAQLGAEIAPETRMGQLRIAETQLVEIARALVHDARVLILDEPTSAISDREVEVLFGILRDLRSRGVAILYISHRMEEIFRLADTITVLRDGQLVATKPAKAWNPASLVTAMVGRAMAPPTPSTPPPAGDPLLTLHGLGRRGAFADVNLELRRGEVLGLAGLMGAGRTSLLHALAGLAPADEGTIRIAGKPARLRHPHAAWQEGIALVGEDRQRTGLVLPLSVQQNLTLASLHRWCRSGWIQRQTESQVARSQITSLGIRARDLRQTVRELSGGNQQKVVLGKALLAQPRILLLDEPTRGIDVGAKAEVHALIRQLAKSNMALLLASSELPELLALSHRVLVLRGGRIVGEVDPRRVTPEEVLHLAMPETAARTSASS